MSRYTLTNFWHPRENPEIMNYLSENLSERVYVKIPKDGFHTVVYGYDFACRYFIQFERKIENDDVDKVDDVDLFVDIDSLFGGLTGSSLATIISKIGNSESNLMLKRHIDLAFLDMEF